MCAALPSHPQHAVDICGHQLDAATGHAIVQVHYESYEHSIPINEKPHATASASDCTEGIAACAFAGMSLSRRVYKESSQSLALIASTAHERTTPLRATYLRFCNFCYSSEVTQTAGRRIVELQRSEQTVTYKHDTRNCALIEAWSRMWQ